MTRLQIYLWGSFRVEINGEIALGFESDKVRALLAYLTIEGDRPHSRSQLVGLLWSELPEKKARTNLSQALSNLRGVIGDRTADPSYLLINRQSIQWNPASDSWVDVNAFTELFNQNKNHQHDPLSECQVCIERLQQTVSQGRGDFLEGFSIQDSGEFGHWQTLIREHLHRERVSALKDLVNYYQDNDAYETALQFAWQLLDLDPWREETHQDIMRFLALTGQRGAALAQYERCCQILEEAFQVEPSIETKELLVQIRNGVIGFKDFKPITPPPTKYPLPAFLLKHEPPKRLMDVFVDRESALDALNSALSQAMQSKGQVVWVSGGAGRGKSALLHEFSRKSSENFPDMLVAMGSCNAFSGVGDPYLPFREILKMLTGEVETPWSTGAISHVQACHLWDSFIEVAQILIANTPFLIDTLISSELLLARIKTVVKNEPQWMAQLQRLQQQEYNQPTDLQQIAFLEQYTSFIQAVAGRFPLLLILDDLQWVDAASSSLLFHLGRKIRDLPIVVVCAYRPEEVGYKREGQPHPLESVLREFEYRYGVSCIDLDQVTQKENRSFSDSLLSTQANRFDDSFLEAFFNRAQGYPLFSVELLRTMQQRGEIEEDHAGRWIPIPSLEWSQLPARVEAVIAARLDRLKEVQRKLLRVASVEGERFTAQVIARVLNIPDIEVLHSLSQVIISQHRLAIESGNRQINSQLVTQYKFAHVMFQTYLYNTLGKGESQLLHGAVAQALENIYQGDLDEILPQLVFHYSTAKQIQPAVKFALRAGEKAQLAFGYEEALSYFRRANAWLDEGSFTTDINLKMKASKGLGLIYYAMGELVNAEIYLRKAIDHTQKPKPTTLEFGILFFRLAESLFWQGKYNDLTKVCKQRITELNTETDSLEKLLLEGLIGLSHYATTGDVQKYRDYAYKAFQNLPRLPITNEITAVYSHIFEILTLDGKVAAAYALLEEQENRAKANHNLKMLARAIWNRGILDCLSGDLSTAIDNLEQAQAQLQQIGDALHEGLGLHWYAEALLASGKLQQSEEILMRLLDLSTGRELNYLRAYANLNLGRLSLAQGNTNQAYEYFQKADKISKALQHSERVWGIYLCARAFEEAGKLTQAQQHYQEAARLTIPDSFFIPQHLLPLILYGLEKVSDKSAFKVFVDHLQQRVFMPRNSLKSHWYLEPTQINLHRKPCCHEIFDETIAADWNWVNPKSDCYFHLDNGLKMFAANGRDLWYINQSAPRLLQVISPKLREIGAAETVCVPIDANKPAIGGLVLWKDQKNYLLFDRGYCGGHEVNFRGHLGGQDFFIGRGSLSVKDSGRVYLRLEWKRGVVRALCSVDGEIWFKTGNENFPIDAKTQIGLYANGNIERSVYKGEFPDGAGIKFEEFQLSVSESKRC